LFSTRYADWKDKIAELYTVYQPVYNLIKDAAVAKRSVVSPGVVEIEYSNQLKLRINYTENYYLSTPPNAFEVLNGGVKD
jgi:hypothetical protein